MLNDYFVSVKENSQTLSDSKHLNIGYFDGKH